MSSCIWPRFEMIYGTTYTEKAYLATRWLIKRSIHGVYCVRALLEETKLNTLG